MTRRAAVAEHYGGERNLAPELLGRLAAVGWRPADGLDAMPPVDELHVRGREATLELLELAAPRPHECVLDAGCGLGGLARRLHARFGCRVVAVDLTPGFCAAARELSRRLGLGQGTRFLCGSATELPLRSGAFDLVLTQHAQMNIADKGAFYAELARALRPSGRLAYHDIFAGEGAELRFPLPWASSPELSALAPHPRVAELLRGAGLTLVEEIDRTPESRAWATGVLAGRGGEARAQANVRRLLMGEEGPRRMANLADALERSAVRVVQALWRRPD